MRRIQPIALTVLMCASLTSPALAQTPALIWAKSFSGGGLQSASALALRGSNLWISGNNNGTIDLGGVSYPQPSNSYLALFGTDGSYQWSHGFTIGSGVIAAMGADASNNVYITGQFNGTMDLGGGPLIASAGGGYDIFLAKFNSAGVHQWSKKFGDAGLNDSGFALVVDSGNNVIIGGRFQGTTDFGGGPLITAGGTDAYIAKFNSAGTHLWSQRFGDAADQQDVDGLATVAGDLYATGKFFGSINLGGSTLTSAGSADGFLVRFNSAGVHQWSRSFGDAAYQSGVDVDTDGFAVYLLSNFSGSENLGGSTLTSSGGQDVALARYTTAGAHQWSQRFGDSDTQTGSTIDVAGLGLYVTGYFEGLINFGHPLSAGSSASDVFVARLNASDGAEVWSQHFGQPLNDDYGSDLVSDGTHTFVGGYFWKDIDFGYHGELFAPARDWDAFVAEFGYIPQEPDIFSVTDVDNDQGGKVLVRFARSDYDALTTALPIRGYEIYLRDDPLNLDAVHGTGSKAAVTDTWVLAGDAPAHGLSDYYALAFTQEDSTLTTGMHTSVYKVRAVTDDPAVYIESSPQGGYSFDNLAPGVPLNFVIDHDELSWSPSGDADMAYYSVYGSAGAFDESAQLVDYTTATHMDVKSRAFARYYVTATDRAGNESRPASLDGTRAATSLPPRTLSVSAFPNPFNPATTIRYTLPSEGRVRIAVYDARGQLVARLVDEKKEAGAYATAWQGAQQDGARVGSGIYFARIEHNGAMRAYKLVVLK